MPKQLKAPAPVVLFKWRKVQPGLELKMGTAVRKKRLGGFQQAAF